MLPLHDVNLACRELVRCVTQLGAVGSFLRPNLLAAMGTVQCFSNAATSKVTGPTSAGVCGTIDVDISALPPPRILSDLDPLMRLKRVMQGQPVPWTSPDIVALEKFHSPLARRAKPCVAVVDHQGISFVCRYTGDIGR